MRHYPRHCRIPHITFPGLFHLFTTNMTSEYDLATVQAFHTVTLCQVAATTFVLYDHFITFDQEIEFIWLKKLSPSKILFIANRYLGDFASIMQCIISLSTIRSTHICNLFFWLEGFSNAVLFFIGGAILSLRVLAILCERSRRSRRIAVILFPVLLGGDLAGMLAVLGLSFRDIYPLPLPHAMHSVCIPAGLPVYFWLFYVPPMALEVVSSAIVMFTSYRDLVTKSTWTSEAFRSILLRDCVFHFIVMGFVYLGSLFAAYYSARSDGSDSSRLSASWLQISLGASISITCIVASRLILNFQAAYYCTTISDDEASNWQDPDYEMGVSRRDGDVLDKRANGVPRISS